MKLTRPFNILVVLGIVLLFVIKGFAFRPFSVSNVKAPICSQKICETYTFSFLN